MTDRPAAPASGDQGAPEDLPEQMRVRREKLQRLVESGRPPYPGSVARTHTLAELRRRFDPQQLPPDTRTGETVSVVGRVIHLRNTGKLCFVRLREGDGTELQAMLSLADLGEESLADYKSLVDIGDFIEVSGEVVTSRRGELSVQASGWTMVAKALRPLPNEHRPLSDEARVRQRYLDLVINPEARAMVRTKAAVLRSLRATLDDRGYVEVETPILQLTNGGAAARPFRTHLNAFDQPMLLRIALELDLKKALIGGVDRVYEIGRTFRNEGLDSTHAAEFSMLEAYEAYGDLESMKTLLRDLVLGAARTIGRTTVTSRDGEEIDLEGPWRSAGLHELVSEELQTEVTTATPLDALRKLAEGRGVELQDRWGAGEVVLELYEKLVEHTLIEPTFVRDYPAEVRPLARPHRSDPRLAEAWDLVVLGRELAPAYSELADPVEQRARLTAQSLLAAGGDPDAMHLDEDFLRALEHGMPPTGGMGMGVDRLLLTLTEATTLRDVIVFPLLRPERSSL
jgi:lysyl-tRNA synthetase class 2